MAHLLLLDDNRAFADNLAEIMRDEGHTTEVVASGAEAVAAVERERFDAFLTDMRMPGMSGAEAVHAVRRVDPGLAAVVITAHPAESDLRSARREGLLAVLPKPVPLDSLAELVSSARRDALVVVIEDDAWLRENVEELLRLHGFSVSSFGSLADAANLPDVRPFAALVDWRVSGGPDGAALRLLRAHFPSLPLIVVTAYPDAAAEAHPDVVFSKPFPPIALLDTLERLYRESSRR